MLKRDANAKTRRILMPLKMYTLATLGSHHSRPGRNSPSNFVALCRKSSSISLWVPKSSYMQNLLKSYFIQSCKRYVLFLQRFDEECRLFRRDSFSLSPGRSRPSSGQSACGLSRPPTNQSVPSVARRPGAEASIKGFLSHVERNGIEVAKSWVFD